MGNTMTRKRGREMEDTIGGIIKRRTDSGDISNIPDDEGRDQVSTCVSSSSNGEGQFLYDVFLSFRGEDTRKHFTGFLHGALKDKGVCAFIDNQDLEKGLKVEELFGCIEKSNIFVPIFSKGYTNSKWCLKEIVKIVQCNRLIVPVFYDVEPRDVRHQTGPFEKDFKGYSNDRKLDPNEVKGWRDALRKTGELLGYNLSDTAGHESDLVQLITKRVIEALNPRVLDVAKFPVALDRPKRDVIKLLDDLQAVGNDGVPMVLIHGMGGIGKTTVAKAIYNDISSRFPSSTFLGDVMKREITISQAKLLGDLFGDTDEQRNHDVAQGTERIKRRIGGKTVFVVLDDIDDPEQVRALGCCGQYLSKQSRIIVTTRDQRVLCVPWIGKHQPYELKVLSDDQSLQLFSYHAFGRTTPLEGYEELSRRSVAFAGGLPLALEVHGSMFFDLDQDQWRETIEMLENSQDEDEIFKSLRSSYDGLKKQAQKEIFLDIACFFIGREREDAEHMWRACGFHPDVALRGLQHRSLLKFDEENVFQMHDLIRDMGRQIVAGENCEEPRMRSRLWESKAIKEALECPYLGRHPMAVNNIKGIVIDHGGGYDSVVCLTTESFQNMDNLRLLVVYDWTIAFQGECKYLPRKLKWLKWIGGSDSEFLPSDFRFGNIVVLDLSHSRLTRLWSQPPSRMKLQELKVLNLSHCEDLVATPDFSWVPSLKKLNLDYCKKLVEIHRSIGQLRTSLEYLSMWWCCSLKELPDSVTKLISLQYLGLRECQRLSALPNRLGDLSSLKRLDVAETDIASLPDMSKMTNLRSLDLSGCKRIGDLPEWIGFLANLHALSLRGCRRLESLPNSIGHLKNLRELGLDGTMMGVLPDSVGSLEKLVALTLNRCTNLKSLEALELDGCWSLQEIPALKNSNRLQRLSLNNCRKLRSLVNINNISNCTALQYLSLNGCCSLQEIPALENSNRLERLSLDYCRTLRCLPQLPPSLRYLSMRYCTSLVGISNLSNLECLEELRLGSCGMLVVVPGLPKALKRLTFVGCAMEILEGLESLEFLEYLWVQGCRRLSRIDRLPPSLQRLLASRCPALKTVDVSNCKSLSDLDVSECTKLVDIEGIEKLNGIRRLRLGGCKNLSGGLAHRIVKEMNMERLFGFIFPTSVYWEEGRTELSFTHPNFFPSGRDRDLEVVIGIKEISEDASSDDDSYHIPDVDYYSEVPIRIQVLMDGSLIFQDTTWRAPPVHYRFQGWPTKNSRALVLVSLGRTFKLEVDIHCPARDDSRIIDAILLDKAATSNSNTDSGGAGQRPEIISQEVARPNSLPFDPLGVGEHGDLTT